MHKGIGFTSAQANIWFHMMCLSPGFQITGTL